MSSRDQYRWDERYRAIDRSPASPSLPDKFEPFVDLLVAAETAIEIACGAGEMAVWLAQHGVQVTAYDISPVAIAAATELADQHGVTSRCTFAVADFDDGLPAGSEVDLVVCHMFRDPSLDQAFIDRLRPTGLLAVAALSEVGAEPGRFRAKAGELTAAFSDLELVESAEGAGVAWLLARKSAAGTAPPSR